MNADELVERFFPCDQIICGNQPSGHSYDCPADYRHHAKRLAAAVREAVLKEKAAEIDRLIELLLHIATCGNGLNRECDRCGTLNSDLTKAAISLRAKRGVVEGET